ncbi:hypothetical protein ABEY43_06040 [Priestia megaterium]
MKIENLKLNETYKNYKMLCEVLEMPVKAGDSKKAQLKEVERYCDFVKVGYSFFVKEIYNKPKEKSDGRGKSEGSRNNNNVYGEFLQFVIADIAKNSKHKTVSFSKGQLMYAANMVNQNYQWGNQNVGKLSAYTSIKEAVIYDFYDTSNGTLTKAIHSALKSLESKRVILWERSVKVKPVTEKIHRKATEQEKRLILYYENETLRTTPYQTIEQVRTSPHWREFKRQCDKSIHENAGIEFYYFAYDITFNEEHIREERDKLMRSVFGNPDSEAYREKLNVAIMEKFKVNAQKRHDTSFTSKKKAKYRIDIDYVKEMNELISLLIDCKAEDVKSEVNKKHKQQIENLKVQIDNEMDFMFG